jgi:hypothetical protein
LRLDSVIEIYYEDTHVGSIQGWNYNNAGGKHLHIAGRNGSMVYAYRSGGYWKKII